MSSKQINLWQQASTCTASEVSSAAAEHDGVATSPALHHDEQPCDLDGRHHRKLRMDSD